MDNPLVNIRIARHVRSDQGVILKTEIAGSWILTEANRALLVPTLQACLGACQTEEPTLGWKLQVRGIDAGWHDWNPEVPFA